MSARLPEDQHHIDTTQSHMDTHETSLDKSSLPLRTGHTHTSLQASYMEQSRFWFFKAHSYRDGPNPELRWDTAI